MTDAKPISDEELARWDDWCIGRPPEADLLLSVGGYLALRARLDQAEKRLRLAEAVIEVGVREGSARHREWDHREGCPSCDATRE